MFFSFITALHLRYEDSLRLEDEKRTLLYFHPKGMLLGDYCQLMTFFLFFFLFLIFRDRVSLCSSGCSGTHSVDPAGLKLKRDLPPPPKCQD